MAKIEERNVVIIGAGPAGLTAAYELGKAGVKSVVLEKDFVVGGLARTINYRGYRFDIGGHRFYTKVKAIEDIWREVLPEGKFLRCKRLSRIYYNKRFFHYPLRASSVLMSLGWREGLLVLLSYLRARLRPERREDTFEQWVTNHFGRRLFRIFFKTYTEKVWGIPCKEITAEWAAQRIKGLSLTVVLKDVLLGWARRNTRPRVRTLADEFHYPELGPGMMWERMAALVEEDGLGQVRLGAGVERICWARQRVDHIEIQSESGSETVRGTHFISSMPARELVRRLDPPAPPEVLEAAERLSYRDFLTVALIVSRRDVFPDNWIYIHEPGVKLGRVQNFKNWSPLMVPDPEKTCLGLEYFCFEGDGMWTMNDAELIELGTREMENLGLLVPGEVEDAVVVRVPKAYPVYDSTYRQSLATLRRFFDSFTNLQLVGRNGMHKYNNQDHSMLTAKLAVENVQGASHDLWDVNADPEYYEEVSIKRRNASDYAIARVMSSQPMVPERLDPRANAATIEVIESEA